MAYNIIDDENRWKDGYKIYVENLSTDGLVKELKFVTKTNNKDIYSSDFINSYEEVYEMKTRIEIICDVIKNKLDKVLRLTNEVKELTEQLEMQGIMSIERLKQIQMEMMPKENEDK